MPKKTSPEMPTADALSQESIETLMSRLQAIATEIQDEKTSLERSVSLYKEGQLIAKHCAERLQVIQQDLEVINPALFLNVEDDEPDIDQ